MSKNKQTPEDQLPALSGEDAAMYGNYTGQGVRKRDPEKYASVVRALKHGLSIKQCSKVFKLDKDTVGAICVRELGSGGMRRATENNPAPTGAQGQHRPD